MIKHLACIMDGNRRWAQAQGLLPWYGHRSGIDAVYRVIDFCLDARIQYLSLFAFAIQNFKRPADETHFLFSLFQKEAEQVLKQLTKKNVRICFVGDKDLFPTPLRDLSATLEQETMDNTKLVLNILFCYGGQEEIVAAVKDVAKKVAAGELDAETLTPANISRHFWLGDIPEPELIVRTGHVKRLSNFLLFQSAYSELYFADCLWPDITKDHLHDAVSYFYSCQRNFGV
jgi:undecaprenyl diphosphate synthase